MTNWLERLLIGDRLSRSAIDTLLDQIARQLTTGSGGDEPDEASEPDTYLAAAPTSE